MSKIIGYLKYVFGCSAYLGFVEWAKRDTELSDLFLEEIKKTNPDYQKAELIHHRMLENYTMWKDSSNLHSDFADTIYNLKPKDFK